MNNQNRSQATVEKVATNVDVLTTKVEGLTDMVGNLAVAMKEGFTKVETRFGKLEISFGTLYEGQENIKERLIDVESGISKLTLKVEDMSDMLESTAQMTSNHEGRITRLEKASV